MWEGTHYMLHADGQIKSIKLELVVKVGKPHAVIDGIEARGERNSYGIERFKFNNYPYS